MYGADDGGPRLVDRAGAALLLVDLQPDFMPGGALAVAEGDRVLAPVVDLLTRGLFDTVVATQDWHPAHHVSFASRHAARRSFDVIELYGREQVLWPDHCVQGTPGARLHDGLPREPLSMVLRKGTDPMVDSYSAFRNNLDRRGERPPTGLAGFLRERGVTQVVLAGLARDYCVLWSAEDAVDAGFETVVAWDLTRPVDSGSDARVRDALAARNVRVVRAGQLTNRTGS
jgi:nicotinamidase/pyrazinamidase